MKPMIHGPALGLALSILTVACGGGEKTGAPKPQRQASSAGEESAAFGSATIRGTATYKNGDPDSVISMDADPVCASLHGDDVHTERIVHDDRGNLANVFIYVKEGLVGSFPIPPESHVLDQLGCQYRPHVSGMQVNQTLIIRNSDPTLHNVHAMPEINQEFNRGQPFQGMEFEHTFDQREVMVRFKCDVHPWMASYMAVLEHPFFSVSAGDGSYSIERLPAGDYVIEAWHEELGTREQTVSIADGAEAEISFDFSPAR